MKKLAIDFLSSTLSFVMFAALLFIAIAKEATSDTLENLDGDLRFEVSETLSFNPEQFPEINCMALNIYYEARSSNLADQYAVADVVLNRVEDTRYPNTICEVVKQGKQKPSWKDPSKMVMVRNACQFSWYCDGKADNPRDKEAWKRAQSIAWDIVQWDSMRGITEGATHYHTTYVNPRWNKSRKGFSITRLGRIGAHIFYRWN